MTSEPTLGYLGPEGTFTHAAALMWADLGRATPYETVHDVYRAVGAGECDYGVVAIESTVEGYVVSSLDAIVGAQDVVAIDEAALDISFDAFVLPDTVGEWTQATAHPHGLAQCHDYVREMGLLPVPASSNAAGCRDITAAQVALGPSICGDLYGLRTLATGVQDFSGAKTRFLLLTGRERARALLLERRRTGCGPVGTSGDGDGDSGSARAGASGSAAARAAGTASVESAGEPVQWRSMIAVTPHEIGPGVLARITTTFGALGVNMSSLITRPIKAQESTYVFIVTLDGAPWEPAVRALIEQLLVAGDSVKTLGVFPMRPMFDGAFDSTRVPQGSIQAHASDADKSRGLLW